MVVVQDSVHLSKPIELCITEQFLVCANNNKNNIKLKWHGGWNAVKVKWERWNAGCDT